MEKLKEYVLKEIIFDNWHDIEGKDFERALSEAVDSCLIYYKDCLEFYSLDPVKVISLSKENGYEVDPLEDEIHQITDYAREAFNCLVYNHLYNVLEERYKEAQKIDKEEFLEADFRDNVDLIIEHGGDLWSYDDLIEQIKFELDNDNLFMVKHLAEALEDYADFYQYDRSMGTMEDPTPLKDNQDLLSIAQDMGLVKED